MPQDQQEAAKWVRLAAEQGIAWAQYNLGVMYANGRGVSRDEREAWVWFRRSADQGHSKAQFNLAVMYDQGLGVPRNYWEARKWYGRVAILDDRAQFNLEVMDTRRWTLFGVRVDAKAYPRYGLQTTSHDYGLWNRDLSPLTSADQIIGAQTFSAELIRMEDEPSIEW
ncbi:MAG: tetratricopeptide repeat protein [Bacteroidota bacterium]|nr:tetratricopeptide repeat protein [Bacteroidota bacterium]